MEAAIKKIPYGMTDFESIIRDGYYYVDKTNLIKELLESRIAEVTLITRPRRFGKTIGMSTLAYFFDIRKDSRKLFEDLKRYRIMSKMDESVSNIIYFLQRCRWIEFSISYEDVKKSDFMDLQ